MLFVVVNGVELDTGSSVVAAALAGRRRRPPVYPNQAIRAPVRTSSRAVRKLYPTAYSVCRAAQNLISPHYLCLVVGYPDLAFVVNCCFFQSGNMSGSRSPSPVPGRSMDIALSGQEVITVDLDNLDASPDDLLDLLKDSQSEVWVWSRLATEYWRRENMNAAEKLAQGAIERA